MEASGSSGKTVSWETYAETLGSLQNSTDESRRRAAQLENELRRALEKLEWMTKDRDYFRSCAREATDRARAAEEKTGAAASSKRPALEPHPHASSAKAARWLPL